jgi:hypothetical protein
MRIWIGVLSLIVFLPLSASGIAPRAILGTDARIWSARVQLKPGDPSVARTGKLVYLGGIRLMSPDRAFGGFSSMHLAGDRFLLLSDRGNYVRFRLGADWVVREPRFGDLPGGPGTGAIGEDRDSEAMAVDPATGTIWVSFENAESIFRFDAGLTRIEASAKPRAMRFRYSDQEAETMVRLRSGRFVVIGEGPDRGGPKRLGLIFAGDPTRPNQPSLRFGYLPPPGYRPTDAAELPDGRLLVVNRRFQASLDLFSAKLTILDLRGIRRDEIRKGVEVGQLARPLLHDNFEAVAIAQENGRTIVWLASDDNGMFWERSLLLKFRLEP